MQVVLIVIWVFLILLFSVRAVRGWSFFFHIRKESWVVNLPLISRFEAKGMATPDWWRGKYRSPIVWFRDKLLGLAIAAIPFNLISLYWYSGAYFGFLSPVWKPGANNMWLILTLLAGWVSGGSLYGQCLYSERHLRSLRQI